MMLRIALLPGEELSLPLSELSDVKALKDPKLFEKPYTNEPLTEPFKEPFEEPV